MPQLEQTALDTIWCVIPTYNNSGTIYDVVSGCLEYCSQILVVDDGSTDSDLRELLKSLPVHVIRHETNRGKGRAILTGLDFVAEHGGNHMITLDGDGQHHPKDLPKFFSVLESSDNAVVIGCRDFSKPNIPQKSKFGRKFANFWLRIETGKSIDDCQSGFRAYPVNLLKALDLKGQYYDFETEVLARAAWAGLKLEMVDIDVWYPEPEKRISSFHPWRDNFRISVMHTKLVTRHLLPIPHKKLIKEPQAKVDISFFWHPIKFLKKLLKENATPEGLAAAAAVGIILGTLPLLFTHTIAIIYVTSRLHLNKVMGVSIQNLCNPPVIPFVCIEIGYFIQHGKWLTSISKEAFLGEIPSLLWSWFLGSLIVAPVFAGLVAVSVFFVARYLQNKHNTKILTRLCTHDHND